VKERLNFFNNPWSTDQPNHIYSYNINLYLENTVMVQLQKANIQELDTKRNI